MKKQERREEKGITLVALVVTIIVLIILAGITLNIVLDQDGIIEKTKEAKNKTEQASDIEKIGLAILEAQMGENEYQKLDANNLLYNLIYDGTRPNNIKQGIANWDANIILVSI